MNRFLPSLVLAFTCALFGLSAAPSKGATSPKQKMEFRFEPGRALTYQVRIRSETSNRMKAGEMENENKVATEMRYKVRLTPLGATNGGVASLRFEPFDYESEMELSNRGGQFKANSKNLSIKGYQNGILVIDTDKGIGTAQAKPLKAEAVLVLLSGQVDLDPYGQAKGFRGDIPFVDFWSRNSETQMGFFGMALPEEAIGEGDWWQKTMPLKSMNDLRVEEALSVTNTFTRKADTIWNGRPIATFELRAPFRFHDIPAFLEQGGQSTRINVSELEQRATGTFRFDQERGVFVDSDTTSNWSAAMTTLVQGRAVSTRAELHMVTSFRLLPDAE